MTGPHRPPASPTLDKAIQCPLLEGDLEQWVRCCTSRFLPLARRVASGDDAAHDALQQSWVIVLEKLHEHRGKSPACGWVGKIVYHEALHGATARSREVPLGTAGGGTGPAARQAQAAGAAQDSPETAAYARELTRLLLEVIDQLPPTYREVVRLRDVDRLPPDEVARRLRTSTGNVAVRLHRAHRLLRPRLLRRIEGSAPAIRPREKKL